MGKQPHFSVPPSVSPAPFYPPVGFLQPFSCGGPPVFLPHQVACSQTFPGPKALFFFLWGHRDQLLLPIPAPSHSLFSGTTHGQARLISPSSREGTSVLVLFVTLLHISYGSVTSTSWVPFSPPPRAHLDPVFSSSHNVWVVEVLLLAFPVLVLVTPQPAFRQRLFFTFLPQPRTRSIVLVPFLRVPPFGERKFNTPLSLCLPTPSRPSLIALAFLHHLVAP